jgi:hypothetical protein
MMQEPGLEVLVVKIRIAACTLALLALGCEFGGEKGEGGGKRVPASLTWISTSLSKPKAAAKAGLEAVHAAARPDTGDDKYLSYRLTPLNLEGRIIQAALMVGVPGGSGGSAIRLVGEQNGFFGKSVAKSTDLSLFNLSQRLTMGEGFTCCGDRYPRNEEAYSGWFEVLFAYADATFRIASGPLAGDHTVRAAFADVEDLGYKRGDLLYKTAGGFQWADSATGALSSTRPAKPLQLGWVAGYAGTGDGRGNQHIPNLFIAIEDSQKVYMPADTVLSHSWEFIADFILADGLIFRRMDPAAMTTPAQMLAHFDIRADRDNIHSGSDGIKSNFYAIKTRLSEPRPDDFKDSLDTWIKAPPSDSGI